MIKEVKKKELMDADLKLMHMQRERQVGLSRFPVEQEACTVGKLYYVGKL